MNEHTITSPGMKRILAALKATPGMIANENKGNPGRKQRDKCVVPIESRMPEYSAILGALLGKQHHRKGTQYEQRQGSGASIACDG